MTNTKELLQEIEKSGLKKSWIADKLSLSYHGLQKKINNCNEFKASEIMMLCDILHITSAERREEIFFAHDVGKMTTK
ncbi:toxin-antitoxin system, antitoxin component, Xre family protein [Hungatella hathewayi]|uniref:toxin-antitoxin system, antitoxin component, Xre family protein n=1 Tax=Hungatella hathewayi TaxID=154046 RepID=UPI0026DCBD50|nr:toxin-antitoxin system, antitoxin component, Xre family protein [Hungatella hathewayi]